MKKFFSILLVCCTAFAYANDDSFLEETDEEIAGGMGIPFGAEEPIFEEGEVSCCDESEPQDINILMPTIGLSRLQHPVNYVSWGRYKRNFGVETAYLNFPQRPVVSQSSALLTAYAYDGAVLYSLVGYYPPLGNIDPKGWFDTLLYQIDHYPFTLINHIAFQLANGTWVMDYVAHDYIQNLILKTRAIVTPFNGYTLQCIKPNGARDYFDYFLDHFMLQCEG